MEKFYKISEEALMDFLKTQLVVDYFFPNEAFLDALKEVMDFLKLRENDKNLTSEKYLSSFLSSFSIVED